MARVILSGRATSSGELVDEPCISSSSSCAAALAPSDVFGVGARAHMALQRCLHPHSRSANILPLWDNPVWRSGPKRAKFLNPWSNGSLLAIRFPSRISLLASIDRGTRGPLRLCLHAGARRRRHGRGTVRCLYRRQRGSWLNAARQRTRSDSGDYSSVPQVLSQF